MLKAPNVIHHIQGLTQTDHRIADQLTGAVPGDLAAPVGVDDGDPVPGPFVRLRAFTGGVDPGVLEQQEGIRPPGHSGIGEFPLELPGRQVVDAAELPDLHRICIRSDGLPHLVDGTTPGLAPWRRR